MSYPHKSVLYDEVLEAFQERPIRYFIDGTLGAGGHSEGILKAHPEIILLTGYDQDEQALSIAEERLKPFKDKLKTIHSNFSKIKGPADGILVDLGVSSMQLDQAEKGFSFMKDGPLDMRMNKQDPLTAAEILNTWPEADIARVFRDYGEEKKWRRAAWIVVQERKIKPFNRTEDLVQILEPALRNYKEKIHPLTRVFQALRIAVNRELEVLELFLPAALKALNPGGRLAVITFHSLEDRIVKHFFRQAASDKVSTEGIGGLFLEKIPEISILTSKPIIPTDEEIEINPRSRSAKLRVIEKI
jgi:16S rRNA (cytosine1402-N4)-methyltransferase